ncbi:sugar nucleotide-binding protein [Pseudomonas sp. CVAP|uniref:sugar nucleotide-binding protein n=1 Tax=Pseudomonas sp. CVAP\|nr:sugar nucleotide-binding protein [Pseudomonas sp. CVAP\
MDSGETRFGCKYLIFPTGWTCEARGNNFAKTMLRLGKDQETLSVIADQIGMRNWRCSHDRHHNDGGFWASNIRGLAVVIT